MSRSLVKGVGLVTTAEMLNRLISFSSFLALAIWLTPEHYGQFAIAWLAFMLADSMFDIGTSVSYFQCATKNSRAFELSCGAATIYGGFWIIYLLVAGFGFLMFSQIEIAELLMLLLLSLVPRIFCNPIISRWTFEANYGPLFLNKLVSPLAGSTAAIASAYYGLEEKSLAIRFLAANLMAYFIIIFLRSYKFQPEYDFTLFRDWFRRGIKYTFTVNWGWMAFMYIEQQAVLHIFGTSALGLYVYAKKVVEVGIQVIGSVSRLVVLPHFIRKHYSAFNITRLGVIIVVVSSLMVGALSLIFPMVESFINPEWLSSVSILLIMLYILPLELGKFIYSMYLISKDRYVDIFISEVVAIILLGISCFYIAQSDQDLIIFTWMILAVVILRSLMLLAAMLRLVIQNQR